MEINEHISPIHPIGKHYYPLMDWIRYILALAVIISHTNELTEFHVPFVLSSYEAVGGFFALSGFLMYPNYLAHNNLLKYTRQRARRILPPYILIVVAAGLSLGLISTLPLSEYYISTDLYKYLAANISFLNWLHPDLPGVFHEAEYRMSAVNGSLWTMKVEWCLYFSVPVFILILRKIRWIRREWLALTIIILSIAYRVAFNYLYEITEKEIFNILGRQIIGQLSFFYCGMIVYFHKDFFIKNRLIIFVISTILYIVYENCYTLLPILSPIAVTGMVMSVSLQPLNWKWLRHRSNISYEMYLSHFPIIQLSIYLGLTRTNLITEYSFVLVATIIFSLASHYCTEAILRKRSA